MRTRKQCLASQLSCAPLFSSTRRERQRKKTPSWTLWWIQPFPAGAGPGTADVYPNIWMITTATIAIAVAIAVAITIAIAIAIDYSHTSSPSYKCHVSRQNNGSKAGHRNTWIAHWSRGHGKLASKEPICTKSMGYIYPFPLHSHPPLIGCPSLHSL